MHTTDTPAPTTPGGRFYDPTSARGDWPCLGARVRMVRYTEGNTLRGDQALPDLWAEGTVTETPASGQLFLSIAPDASSRPLGTPVGRAEYDRHRPEAWSISRRHVTIHWGERWQWTIQHLEDVVDEVADDVVHLAASGAQVTRLRVVLAELDDELASDERTSVEQAALVDELRRLAAALVAEA